jgi:hypothetical protein
MYTLVHDTEHAWLENAAKHKTEFETCIAFWLSTLLVVVEGFNALKLDATQVPELSDPRVDTLRLFRNGCFHYQRDYQKFAPIGLSGCTCSSALTSPSTARSNRLGRIVRGV